MKDDLKRLVNEFLEETREERLETYEVQVTQDSPMVKETKLKTPTFQDFIWWLND